MAKNIKNNNALFEGFKAPKIEPSKKKEESKTVKKETPKIEPKVEPKEEIVEPATEKEPVQVIEKAKPVQSAIDEMAFSLPRSGRPKTLEGKYHTFSARIREDLYEYAKNKVEEGNAYQSINDYINRLIARDMLSK